MIINLNISLLLKPCLPKPNIQVTACGQHHLRAALGSRQLAKEYVTIKIESWTEEVSTLVEVAASKPHTAYCAFYPWVDST